MSLLFFAFIPGKTPGKARPRVTRNGTHLPKPYQQWMAAAANRLACLGTHYGGHPPGALTIPVRLTVQIILPAPKRKPAKTSTARRSLWYSSKERPSEPFPWMGKPDVDNAAGSVLDALVKAGVLADDTLVSRLDASMWASHDPEQVGACVEIHTLPDTP